MSPRHQGAGSVQPVSLPGTAMIRFPAMTTEAHAIGA